MQVINCTYLNARVSANASSTIKKVYKKGDKFIVTASKKVGSSTWYKSEAGYWSNGKYLKKLEDLSKGKSSKTSTTKNNKNSLKSNKTSSLKATTKEDKEKTSTSKSTKGSYVSQSKKKKKSTKKKGKTVKNVLGVTAEEIAIGNSESFTEGMSSFFTKDYTINTSFLDSDIKELKQDLSLTPPNSRSVLYNSHYNFNRFKMPDVINVLPKTMAYVFFTRPDLNILKKTGNKTFLATQTAKIPEFYYLMMNDPSVLKALTSDFSTKHQFHPFLSNMVNSFELSDEYIDTNEVGETLTGYKIQYGGSDVKSKTSGKFSINFGENCKLQVYKTVKIWEQYISAVYRGELEPKRDYIRSRVLDYAVSAYYILCDATIDNKILFWSKYYGVFPTNSPSATLSWSKGKMLGMPEYDISFAYAFKEDFSPLALAEFNELSDTDLTYRLPYAISESENGAQEPLTTTVTNTWVGAPFIETIYTGQSDYNFYLRFRDKTSS